MTPDTSQPTETRAAPTAASARASLRTCVGCGAPVTLDDDVVRVVLGPPAPGDEEHPAREIAIDAGTRRSGGRGASLHPTPKCVGAAAQRGLNRSFKAKLAIDGARLDTRVLASAIVAALDRRIAGLLASAVRSKHAFIGSEPVCAALRSESARESNPRVLVVVATNAEAAANTTEVRRAVADGRAVAWSNKQGLAAAVLAGPRSEGVGVVAIVERNLAAAFARRFNKQMVYVAYLRQPWAPPPSFGARAPTSR
ncbi:MAG: YlxR family protein [Polyangiaceae bacterium]